MAREPRQLQVEEQQVGGVEQLTIEERAAIEASLDLHEHPDTYTERAWRFVKPWLMKEQVKGVPTRSGSERLTALREQRRQLFQAVDRLRSRDARHYIGRRQLERFQTTIKDETYTFMRPLGAGGFGVTFDALQDSTNRNCVVKCMMIDQQRMAIARKAIVEVSVLRKLKGLHAPKLLDAQFQPHPTDRNRRMLVTAMERVHGEDGEEIMMKYGPEQPDAILQRVHALLRAVHDIHQAGVLHLDLKPEHVFFSEDGQETTFIDYGIAHVPALAEKQQHGRRLTSPRYAMIPERAKLGTPTFAPADHHYTTKFDAFSVGRIIHEFIYKQQSSDLDQRVQEFRRLPTPLQQLSRIAEQMVIAREEDRLDITGAMAEFLIAFPEFAQPQVATAKSA